MRHSVLLLGGLMAVIGFIDSTQAKEDELAPGFNQCMEQSGGITAAMNDCVSDAYAYWDKQLNVNYKQAMGACSDSMAPQACRQSLKQAERSWIAYKDNMSTYLVNKYGAEAIGSLDLLNIKIFVVEQTRRQAQLLQSDY